MKEQSDQKTPASALENTVEEGINLEVPGAALAEQAGERAAWHRQCAESITEELKTIGSEAENKQQPDDWRRTTRRTDLLRRQRQHEEHARFLDFVQRHISPQRLYRVSQHDLLTCRASRLWFRKPSAHANA